MVNSRAKSLLQVLIVYVVLDEFQYLILIQNMINSCWDFLNNETDMKSNMLPNVIITGSSGYFSSTADL
jgi:hypothetical protein